MQWNKKLMFVHGNNCSKKFNKGVENVSKNQKVKFLLIHEDPAIVGCRTPSAAANTTTARPGHDHEPTGDYLLMLIGILVGIHLKESIK
jgi:hypothetical protein